MASFSYNTPSGHAGAYYPFSATPSPAGSPSGGPYGYARPGPAPRHHSRHTSSGDAYGYSSPRGAFSPRYNSSGYYATAANVSRNKSSWSGPRYEAKRRNSYSHRASYGDSDEDEYAYVDYIVDGKIYRVLNRPPSRPTFNSRGHGTDRYYYSQAQYAYDDPDASPPYEPYEQPPPPQTSTKAISSAVHSYSIAIITIISSLLLLIGQME